MHPDGDDEQLTVGVEEEFFLVDHATRQLAPVAHKVSAELRRLIPNCVNDELSPHQIELVTPPCCDLGALHHALRHRRRRLGAAAAMFGCLALPTGTPPLDSPGPPPVTDDPRYHEMTADFRILLDDQGFCGCHVHIGVPDKKLAIQVCNHLRPWLAVLLALGANSPFVAGQDSGYASWRAILWSRWPTSGPPPMVASVEHLDALIQMMITGGAARDARDVYWFARPSPRWQTVEIRIFDTQPDSADTLLLAALSRALVATALGEIRSGIVPVPVDDATLRIAHWRAARDGLAGSSTDPLTGELKPAWLLVRQLVDHVTPALTRIGDLEIVQQRLHVLGQYGNGAERQHGIHTRQHRLTDVVDEMSFDM